MSATRAADIATTDDARVRAFLADSLALWSVAGCVEAGHAPVVAVITAASGTTIRIERPVGEDMPFRWVVRSFGAEDGSSRRTERTRPCASLVGLLNALRGVLDVDRGTAVRVTPAPEELPPLRSGGGPGWVQ